MPSLFVCTRIHSDWQQKYGGCTSYIAKGDDEEVCIYLSLQNALFTVASLAMAIMA